MAVVPVEEQFIGAGQVYVDGVLFGSTRENNVFRVMQEMAAPVLNGVAGILARTDYHNRQPFAELEVTMVELSGTALPYAIPGAEVTTDGDDTVIRPSNVRRLQDADYHKWEIRVVGISNREVRLIIAKGIATGNAEFTAQDAGDQPIGPRITIQSRVDPDDTTLPPWEIRRTPASYS